MCCETYLRDNQHNSLQNRHNCLCSLGEQRWKWGELEARVTRKRRSLVFKMACVAKNIWRITNTTACGKGIIVRVVSANRGESKASSKHKLHLRGGACVHTIVQAVLAFKYECSYPIGYFTSHDPQMFFKYVTRLHVYSLITYSDLNQQQIDWHYSCTVNLTGNWTTLLPR